MGKLRALPFQEDFGSAIEWTTDRIRVRVIDII
jgi:hypothetical protein